MSKIKMTLTKGEETVVIHGPVLYHKNPYRQVSPTKFNCKQCGKTVFGDGMFVDAIVEIQRLGWKVLWPTRDDKGGFLCPEHAGDAK